jgi:hypothetical protein
MNSNPPDSLIPLAAIGGFTLFERQPALAWQNLKLIRVGAGRKKNWSLAWNGERLAVNHDAVKLAERHPEIERWVIGMLKGKSL